MSMAKQHTFWAGDLFSSALFCLWLSTASLMVGMDLGGGAVPGTLHVQEPSATPAATAPAVTPEREAGTDAA